MPDLAVADPEDAVRRAGVEVAANWMNVCSDSSGARVSAVHRELVLADRVRERC